MALLDVSFVVDDPMLSNTFEVVRRTAVVGTDGRTAPSERTYRGLTGVITNQDPAQMMRNEVGQVVPRSIFIATKFAIQGATAGHLADVVLWKGGRYEVQQAYDYSSYGQGFHEAVAAIMTATNPPSEA